VGVAVLQGGIGYLQYFTEVPPLLVGLHVAGATLVWVMTLRAALVSGDTASSTPSRDAMADRATVAP
jgi:cytochrome c oxidase assembly protein subunit 15